MICIHCGEVILPHEAITVTEGKMHHECLLRSTIGSVAHQQRRCSCFGGNARHSGENGMTKRENAQAAAQSFFESWNKAAKAKFN